MWRPTSTYCRAALRHRPGRPEVAGVDRALRQRGGHRLRRVDHRRHERKGLVANLLWLVESEYPQKRGNKPGLAISLGAVCAGQFRYR